jgi:hypothetical protein
MTAAAPSLEPAGRGAAVRPNYFLPQENEETCAHLRFSMFPSRFYRRFSIYNFFLIGYLRNTCFGRGISLPKEKGAWGFG